MNMRYAKRSEDTEQINVVSWAGWNMNRYPELKWLFHVPNGGSRNKQEAVKFKQMGVKAGVSDLCLPYPKGSYCGLFVEMKFGNNRQQDTQKEFLADMAAAGHFVATCYSAEEAIKVIEEYLNLSDAVHMERKSSRFGRIVNSIGGSSSTYTCDYFWWNAGITAVALVGGSCDGGDSCGADYLALHISAGSASWNIGASVFLEQPIAA